MKYYRNKSGMTLIEILTVVAIIAILVAVVVISANRMDTRAKENLAKSTIEIVCAALEEFGDYGYRYEELRYSTLKFPLDCNGLSNDGVEGVILRNTPGVTSVMINPEDDSDLPGAVLYFFLNRVPASRKVLEKIDKSLITNLDKNKQPMTITIVSSGSTNTYPLYRIIDPWKTSLRYEYYKRDKATGELTDIKTFPVITSAGPDKKFDTADDISNK